jgi:MoaA/NifB/PqqE/SkfB family radical SAM enzyme
MKLFCKLPFTRVSIDDAGDVWPACCPEWVAFPLGNIFKQSWQDIWYGDDAKRFRDSMLDGSLKYCNRNWCPNIGDAEAGIKNYHVIPLAEAPAEWIPAPPVHVNLNYDYTCNLRCPTCRSELIHYRGEKLKNVQYIQEYVENQILPTVESVALTGVGDPFMSQVFRNFLMNFDKQKYPNIKTIHFHTNGQLFDEEMYDKMKGLHHLNISTDISIDAASAAVYNNVRPPGNWDRLMKNLDFIKRLDNLVLLGISMVVQRENFREMPAFIELGESLVYNKRNSYVEFKRLRQYYGVTDQDYKNMSIDSMDTLMQTEFFDILNKVEKKRKYNAKNGIRPDINHNLQEYLIAANANALPLTRLKEALSSKDIFQFLK